MKGFCLEVSGPYACFTRPEMKVERVSYDVITPSAARAVFEAILWKPAIQWHIRKIEVLAPVTRTSVRRNEVAKTASPRMKEIFIEDNRQQRAGYILKDVKYRLHGYFTFIPPESRPSVRRPLPETLQDKEELAEARVRTDETEAKYAAIFERRAKKGQYFHHPYLGCREFAADVRLVTPDETLPAPVNLSDDLGFMLYDMDFSDPKNIRPMFFRAQIKNGVIDVPAPDSPEVLQ